MSYEFFIGVDPGKDGGVAILNWEGTLVSKCVMPDWDDPAYGAVSLSLDPPRGVPPEAVRDGKVLLCVEKVWAMPRQGVVSMFTFGKVTGIVTGVLQAILRTKAREVAPQTWQRGLWGSAGDPKLAAREFAETNWPEEIFLATKRSRKPHQGMVDAACIAEWARRNTDLYEGG